MAAQSSGNSSPARLDQLNRENINELWKAVDTLRETKQSKISAQIWIPILVYLISLTVAGIWGSATISANITALNASVQLISKTQYSQALAASELALRDKDIETNAKSITELKGFMGRIEKSVASIEAHVTAKGHDR